MLFQQDKLLWTRACVHTAFFSPSAGALFNRLQSTVSADGAETKCTSPSVCFVWLLRLFLDKKLSAYFLKPLVSFFFFLQPNYIIDGTSLVTLVTKKMKEKLFLATTVYPEVWCVRQRVNIKETEKLVYGSRSDSHWMFLVTVVLFITLHLLARF